HVTHQDSPLTVAAAPDRAKAPGLMQVRGPAWDRLRRWPRPDEEALSRLPRRSDRVRAAASRPPRPKASVAARAPPTTTEPKARVMIESAMPMYCRPMATNSARVA